MNLYKGLQVLCVVKLQEEACELPGKTIIQWNSKTYPGMCGTGMWWMFWNNVCLSTWSLGPIDSDMNPKKTTHCRNVDRC